MNEALPKLLRSIASGTDAMASKQSVIFNAAADEIERLRAENARLRAVLKKIADDCGVSTIESEIAKAALADQGKG